MTALWLLSRFSGYISPFKLSGSTAVESEDRLHVLLLVIDDATLISSALSDDNDLYFFSASVHSPTRPFWIRNWRQLGTRSGILWASRANPGRHVVFPKQTSPGSR